MLKQRKIRWAELRSEVAADAKEAGTSFAKRLVMRVVENLQIKVKHVHVGVPLECADVIHMIDHPGARLATRSLGTT